ncbi:MAG: hypothetical protein PHE83_09790, partial [Opitutaceae bacterium]|nr:hypothetical protein [Opitutaceae bacterium]
MPKAHGKTATTMLGAAGRPMAATSAAVPDLDALVRELQHAAGDVTRLQAVGERPLYGTTLYLATCNLDTRFGIFRAYI